MTRSPRAPSLPLVRFDSSVWTLPKLPSVAAGAVSAAVFAVGRWRGASAVASAAAVSMHQPQDARIHRLAGETMGTRWSLRLANADFLPLEDVRGLVQSVLDAVIAQMSNWDARSVISEFNRLPAGDWLELPPAFSRVLSAALEWARRSGGALDPTMGALVSLWGFGPRADPMAPHSGVAPSAEVIASTLAVAGFDRLERLDLSAESVRIRQSGGLELDLCGIAKGFAVDEVVRRLQQAGWLGGLKKKGGE